MGGLDLSKGSNDLKMYVSRNTGPVIEHRQELSHSDMHF